MATLLPARPTLGVDDEKRALDYGKHRRAGGVAYNDAKLDEDLPAGNGGYAGDRLPYAPAWTTNPSADYEWAIGNAAAFVGGNIRLLSDQLSGFDDSYRTDFGRRMTIEGYAVADLGTAVQAAPIRPRTIGFTLGLDF